MSYIKTRSLVIFFLFLTLTASAQNAPWQGKGRIAISSDGNEHDHDDWGATPLSLAMLAASGLQYKLVLYTYSDHVWGSNIVNPNYQGKTAYEQMKESTLVGAKMFGFKKSPFTCAVDAPERAYNKMAKAINESSEENPLFIIAAGPMQVVGEGIRRSHFDKRKYVTVISHSNWNNTHSENADIFEPLHHGWTFKSMKIAFEKGKGGSVKFVRIADQNGGDDYLGLKCAKENYDWLKTSKAKDHELYKKGAWEWLYTRLETHAIRDKDAFDPSDAGMVLYLLTGVEKTNPNMVCEILENPQNKKK